MTNPLIYTSEYLRTTPKTAKVAKAIFAALDRLHIEHKELKHTNDYWCRDYMPVMLFDDGIYARYEYKPDYLYNYKSKRRFITEQQQAYKELNLYLHSDMNIIFDGGNYVRCGTKVIMTDKILTENPGWPLPYLFRHLSDALCADIILLPWDMEDPCGHADGMVSYLGENRVLLNSCWKYNNKDFHNRLLKILKAYFDVVELDYNCTMDEDSWCYLNYLQVSGGILLPCQSENFDCRTDIAAIETFSNLFPHDQVIPIYAKPLIEDGGAIHCVTWEYVEKCVTACP